MIYCTLLLLLSIVTSSPTEVVDSSPVEGSGWIFREDAAVAAAADSAPLTSDPSPTLSVKTRDVKCISSKVCTGDHECGERGSCLGFLSVPGTCNCAACVNLWTCRDDKDCGGLKGACDVMLGTCRCMQALERNGFRLLKATSSFCSIQKCREDHREEDCLGLPCHTGRCFCKYSWVDN